MGTDPGVCLNMTVVNLVDNVKSFFQNDYTNLCSHKQWMSDPLLHILRHALDFSIKKFNKRFSDQVYNSS